MVDSNLIRTDTSLIRMDIAFPETNGGFPVGNGVGDEFGGQDVPHGCLPDYHWTKCPHRKQGLFGDDFTDKRYACELTSRSDADGRGFGYDQCICSSDDYRRCLKYIFGEGMEKIRVGDSKLSALEDAHRNGKFILDGLGGG